LGNPNEREIAKAFTEPEKALFLLRGIHSPSTFVWSHNSGSAGEIDAAVLAAPKPEPMGA